MTDSKAAAPGTPLATAEEIKQRRAEVEKEWGTWIAADTIMANGVIAYNAGDPIPASNVVLHKYDADGLAVKIESKAGQDKIRELHEAGSNLGQPAPALPPVSLALPQPKDSK